VSDEGSPSRLDLYFSIAIEPDVVRIETEQDIERLRQVALLQQTELHRLSKRLVQLTAALAEARGEDAIVALQQELAFLREEMAARNRELFGASSEKRQREKDGASEDGAGATTERSGHGRREQPELPRIDVVHILDEPDRPCPKCGGELREWDGQFEDAEEIDVVERSFRIVRHRRQKYTCRCGECIETALGPRKLIVGGRYSVDFAVAVAVAKYADHLPLARQVKQMARSGLTVDTQTLWDQLHALAGHLGPTHEAIWRLVLSSEVVLPDETQWPLLDKPGSSKWFAWSAASQEAVAYRILHSRSAEAARTALDGFAGILVTDGYVAYQTMRDALASERAGPPIVLAHCWAHVRRKFHDAEPAWPEAQEMLELIGKLYAVEREVSELGGDERRARLAALRRERSSPVVDEIRAWLLGRAPLPRSGLGKAVAYTLSLWDGLGRFVDDARIPLDTNLVERGMRPLAVGRKNHYGSKSERGTRVAALFYTLIESAKLVGVEPAGYLAEATRRAIDTPGTVTLPRDLLPS